MMPFLRPFLFGVISSTALFGAVSPGFAVQPQSVTIVLPREASGCETLAAWEVRRYIYLRTGECLSIVSELDVRQNPNVILVGRKDRTLIQTAAVDAGLAAAAGQLAPQNYLLKTTRAGNAQRLLLIGGDEVGTLYAAYRFAEIFGVRFYLHGDVIPDERITWKLPVLDERGSPAFALRGIQPFHDFPEGPDWWNRDDYLAIVAQLPKLRLNFFGLHTYPEERPNAEPTVWIGSPQDLGAGGQVKFSYPSSYQNTLRGNWGYESRKTSEFVCGSAALFERDDFGPEVMQGAMPSPGSSEANNKVFDRTAAMLGDAFAFAHQLGIKTCVGTETPLVVPKLVQERLKVAGKNPADVQVVQELYEGIFQRAAQAYPLDYYWFWTPEDWTWSAVKEAQIAATTNDLLAAIAAHKKVQPPFRLATCGWVLGPQQDRTMFDKALPKTMAVSCINREVGYSPVEPGFAQVHSRSKWAIPWLEDDPALTSPQLWVGRMRRDAFDALRYKCDGLMGIHWRTRVLGPNISALARAAWDQNPWADSYKPVRTPPPPIRVSGPVGGQSAAFPNNRIADTAEEPLYQTVRYNLSAYHLPATNGSCTVTLKFCEPHYSAAGQRAFDVKLQGRSVITNLDIFATVGKNRALDFTFENVVVTNGWLDIDFIPRIEFPSIAAIAVRGNGFRHKINCGGPAYAGYAADLPSSSLPKPILPATKDFYEDWARHQFGQEVAMAAGAIFEKLDGALPHPCTWVNGPGGIQPDPRSWSEVRKEYTFVDELAALRPKVKGPGNQERFQYWLDTFTYLRTVGELNCTWAEYNRVLEKVKREMETSAQRTLARQMALPLRERLAGLVNVLFEHLLATVSTPGELGTVANWNQHNLPELLTKPGDELAKMLGQPLPAEAQPAREYHGPTRVIVPTIRTIVNPNEKLQLKVLVLAETPPREVGLYWSKLGNRSFEKVLLTHEARGVYSRQLPEPKDDFEYYVKVESGRGKPVFYPATAPRLNQTVVLYRETVP